MKGPTGISQQRNPIPQRPLLLQWGKKDANLGFMKCHLHQAGWQSSSFGVWWGMGVNWATWSSTLIKSVAAWIPCHLWTVTVNSDIHCVNLGWRLNLCSPICPVETIWIDPLVNKTNTYIHVFIYYIQCLKTNQIPKDSCLNQILSPPCLHCQVKLCPSKLSSNSGS